MTLCSCFTAIREILEDPAASIWVKQALSSALCLDSEDAASNAEVVADVLNEWPRHLISHHSPSA